MFDPESPLGISLGLLERNLEKIYDPKIIEELLRYLRYTLDNDSANTGYLNEWADKILDEICLTLPDVTRNYFVINS